MTMTLILPSKTQAASPVEQCCAVGVPRAVRGELPVALALRFGGEAVVSIRYELLGREEAPLLIVAGGISAGRHVLSSGEFPELGWWEGQAASFDLSRFRVLAVDWIGADGLTDCPIYPADQAAALVHLLERLDVHKAAAFIGASYGGMVGMHFAAEHPQRLGKLLSISAAAQAHPFSSACRALQRRAVTLGETAGDAAAGVALARSLAMLTYRTPEEFADRFAGSPTIADGTVRVAAEDYLDHHGERHCRRMSASAYLRLSESIDLHCIDPIAIAVPLALAAVDSDALVPPADVRVLADAIPGARFQLLHSRYGHDAFLKEEAQVAALIADFLETLEPTA